jgi:hypothetical protein
MDNLELTPVGGPGKEFWVFGKNYENEPRYNAPEDTYERAAWRIELSPKKLAHENYFLNIMQIMDSNGQKLNVGKVEGDKVVGVHISDRIVLFSKYYEPIDSRFTFSIKEDGKYKILLTDLVPGEWQVLKDKKIVIPTTSVKGEDGTLYVEGTKGEYTVTR